MHQARSLRGPAGASSVIREEECDPFENIAEEDIMLEDITELAIDSDHEDDELEIADV